MTKTELIEKYLASAQKYVGKVKKGEKSMTPIVTLYNSQEKLPRGVKATNDSAYCAIFQTSNSIECGVYGIFTPEMGAYEMMKGEKTAGRFFSDHNAAEPGDLIFFKYTGYHVGVVKQVTYNKIITIEGNAENGETVSHIITRASNDPYFPKIVGFSRPAWETKTKRFVTITMPFWCLTTPYGPEYDKGGTVTVPCNVQPAGEGIRNFLREGEVYEVVDEIGGYISLKVIGEKFTWTPWFPKAYTKEV